MKKILAWWYSLTFECKFHYCCYMFGFDRNVYSLTDDDITIIYTKYSI